MNDYLQNLVARDLEASVLIQPRIPGWFEQEPLLIQEPVDLAFEEIVDTPVAPLPSPNPSLLPAQTHALQASEPHRDHRLPQSMPSAAPMLQNPQPADARNTPSEREHPVTHLHTQTETIHHTKEVARPMQWPLTSSDPATPQLQIDSKPVDRGPSKSSIRPQVDSQSDAKKASPLTAQPKVVMKTESPIIQPHNWGNPTPLSERVIVEKIREKASLSPKTLRNEPHSVQRDRIPVKQGAGERRGRLESKKVISAPPPVALHPRVEVPTGALQPPPSAKPSAAEPHTVRITIGRMEIRAELPAKPKAQPKRRTPTLTSLSEYLDGAAGRGER